MARNSCSALRPIARYLVTWNAGGYQVSQSSFQGQSDPYRNQVLTWLSQLAEQDYQQDLPHAGPPPQTAPGSSQLAEQHYQQVGRCLARADGVLLDIRRRLEQEKTNEAGRIYSFDITVYKWPRLGWVWLTCLGLAILALVVSALGLWLVAPRPAPQPNLATKPNEPQDDALLRERYQQAQSTIQDLTRNLREAVDRARVNKAEANILVMAFKYSTKDGETTIKDCLVQKATEDWLRLCEFLEQCAKRFAADKPQEPAKQGEGQ